MDGDPISLKAWRRARDVARFADMLGVPLEPWQIKALREVAQGKSIIVLPRKAGRFMQEAYLHGDGVTTVFTLPPDWPDT